MRHIRKFGGAKVKLSAEAQGGNEVVGGLIHCKDRVRDINSYGSGSETKILPACIHLNDKKYIFWITVASLLLTYCNSALFSL